MKEVLTKLFFGALLFACTFGMLRAAVVTLDQPESFVNEFGECERVEEVVAGELKVKSPCPDGWQNNRQTTILSPESQYRIESGLIEQPSYDMDAGIQPVRHPEL